MDNIEYTPVSRETCVGDPKTIILAKGILKKTWGFADFRLEQQVVITWNIEGNGVFYTGGGKSLVCQVSIWWAWPLEAGCRCAHCMDKGMVYNFAFVYINIVKFAIPLSHPMLMICRRIKWMHWESGATLFGRMCHRDRADKIVPAWLTLCVLCAQRSCILPSSLAKRSVASAGNQAVIDSCAAGSNTLARWTTLRVASHEWRCSKQPKCVECSKSTHGKRQGQ